MAKLLIAVLLCVSLYGYVAGHGMVMDPVNRASRWRVDGSANANYDDNQLWCGGSGTQHQQNGGKCGFCGDNYSDGSPRAHELGGFYGQGVVVKEYNAGGTITVEVKITANHFGYFYFNICNVDQYGRESDDCFSNRLRLTDGSDIYTLPNQNTGNFYVDLQIPSSLTCNHCVLQWTYVTANAWGDCGNGTGALGCGPQEHFRTCSDIKIR